MLRKGSVMLLKRVNGRRKRGEVLRKSSWYITGSRVFFTIINGMDDRQWGASKELNSILKGKFKQVWNDRSIFHSSKIRLMRSFVTSIFLYACESWTFTAELQRRLQAMEMRRYRKKRLIKTMSPTRKSVPRSSRQLDHTKTWPWYRDANCNGMDMSAVHQVWSKPSCKAQWKGEEDKADRGRAGKTTSGNGQAWSSPSPGGQ